MKLFSEQFRECKEANLVGSGEGPEIVIDPLFPRRAFIERVKKEGKLPTARLSTCKRFSGTCSSGNEECVKLRNQTE